MTEGGVFLGGGGSPGSYNSWSIPDIYGKFSYSGTEGAYTDNALFYQTGNGWDWPGFDHSWSTNGHPFIHFQLSRLDDFKYHIDHKLYPDHYTVEYWIKYK